jgi:hypothetical protein
MRRERRFPSVPFKLFLVMAIGAILTLGCASAPTRHDGGEGQLKPLTIASIETPEGEQGIQVVIRASGPFSYSLSNHDRPPRILVEIPNGQFARLAPHIPVNKGVVQAIDLQERGNQARVEIVLDRLVNYGVQKEENSLVLNFKDPMAAARQQEAGNLPRPLVSAVQPSD